MCIENLNKKQIDAWLVLFDAIKNNNNLLSLFNIDKLQELQKEVYDEILKPKTDNT